MLKVVFGAIITCLLPDYENLYTITRGGNVMSKGYDSRAIANMFVHLSNETGHRLTIMSLLKYVYFAHGWTLGYTEEPLINHGVYAWKHGPVVTEVYDAFRPQGVRIARAVLGYPKSITDDMDDIKKDIIYKVYETYSALTPFQLSAITHKVGTPWHNNKDPLYKEIPRAEILSYYLGVVRKIAKDV